MKNQKEDYLKKLKQTLLKAEIQKKETKTQLYLAKVELEKAKNNLEELTFMSKYSKNISLKEIEKQLMSLIIIKDSVNEEYFHNQLTKINNSLILYTTNKQFKNSVISWVIKKINKK